MVCFRHWGDLLADKRKNMMQQYIQKVLTRTLRSIKAIFSQFPCLGVLRNLKHSHSAFAFDDGTQTWKSELQGNLKDKNLKCIAMPAPAVRYAFSKASGLKLGSVNIGKMLAVSRG